MENLSNMHMVKLVHYLLLWLTNSHSGCQWITFKSRNVWP